MQNTNNQETKFSIATIGFVVILLLITSIVFYQIDRLGKLNDQLIEQDMQAVSILKDALSTARDNAIATAEYFLDSDKGKHAILSERIKKNRSTIDKKLETLDRLILDSENKDKLNKLVTNRKAYIAISNEIVDLITNKNDIKTATYKYTNELNPKLERYMEIYAELMLGLDKITKQNQEANKRALSLAQTILLSFNLIIIGIVTFGWFWIRGILRNIQKSSIENLKFRVALDCTSTNLMMADNDRVITYMNKSIKKMFAKAEADLKKQYPNFNLDNMIGTNIDTFHKNPSHQKGLLTRISEEYKSVIEIGERKFTLLANPIIDSNGVRYGTAVEWSDITAELAAKAELEKTMNENLQIRVALDNVTTNVMMADNDRNIVYMNKAIVSMFTNAESDIRKQFPSFSAANIMGKNIDIFHKNPAHQKQILNTFSSTYNATINIGGRTFTLAANPVVNEKGERLGSVVEWKDITSELLAKAELEKTMNENLQIRVALDHVTTNVMMADKNRNIVYMNKSIYNMFHNAEMDIRKQFPGFDAKNLIGKSIDSFHRNPMHQQQILGTIATTHNASIQIAGRSFSLSANPVINDKGERLGSVVEWQDITSQLAIQKEIDDIITGAAKGDFSKRISSVGKEGFYKQLTEGMNRLMEVSSIGLEEVVRVLGALEKGDLNEKITNDYEGTFGKLKDYTNNTVAKLTEIISEVRRSTDALVSASEEVSSTAQSLSQSSSEQAASVEE
ncbi:MAG TPA: MCP four helix bundle domain-containing protein, partial [Leptospiraceae bacterium]|nr:MCP four helix bundle domain-containing protein [Leptospiraceae bacterium]